MSSSDDLKKYSTRILFVVAIVVVLYGIFYLVDQFSSYLYQYQVTPIMWLLFRLFLAVAIIYIGLMLFKMERIVSKTSLDFFKTILFQRKKSPIILFLMMLSVLVPTVISFCTSSPWGNYGYFPHYGGQLIHKDQFAGYYGHKGGLSCVRITDSFDLQMLLSRAQTKGYAATYRLATYPLLSPKEYCVISRKDSMWGRRWGGPDFLGVWCKREGNETSFYHAVPVWIGIDCQETSEDWFESKLREFFPNSSDQEYSEFARRLASGYNTINISESPDWTSIKNYLGAFDYVSCVPISDVIEYYSNGEIHYDVPSVLIEHTIPLDADKSVTFALWTNGWGFAQIKVESEYLLYEHWIREIFFMIFSDVGLPADVIWEFTVEENYYITYD